ncbi:Fe-Mn family superoxide dismutase [Parachlamydia sp. AcF125]|uniref:superoxide dismutase n=1 Tax=Parachlamydia sp. AcF125 TaxID=2795736 RepID=UPI001BC92DEB|nr:Fe-Mn family superoxide dismutase [Parachlamydia sp. AcF125]MBS4168706.1 Superoxide dismutase [Fe] [Parachlamydia sp. AcF125]
MRNIWLLAMSIWMSFAQVGISDQPAASSIKKYEARNFDHLLGKIKGLNDELLRLHFKLYQGYVNNANTLFQKIEEFSQAGKSQSPEVAGFKHMLGWEFNGMILHEYYFENLGGKNHQLKQDNPLFLKIVQDFGSYASWKADFQATGAIRGIGWVITYIDPKQGRLVNTWINEHDVGHLSGGQPLLVMDVFEHAYITQFGLDRAKYIQIFFDNIDWEVVFQRYQKSLQAIRLTLCGQTN